MSTLLITGGAGFIGSNFARFWHQRHQSDCIVIIDALSYAGNLGNIDSIACDPRVSFIHGDVCDEGLLTDLFAKHDLDTVVHFAAESHVDRSIVAPDAFIQTNIKGTHVLLKVALASWKGRFAGRRFHHISTDEVYGSLGPDDPPFAETTRYDPHSPYAASKAASDFLVQAYGYTYGLPFTMSNCSNNYGPFQFPEKIIPVVIINALTGRPLPVYGDGQNVRDWIHVHDHCAMIEKILEHGRLWDTYNVGGGNEISNIDLVNQLCDLVDQRVAADSKLRKGFAACPAARNGRSRELVTFVNDRPGHDRRYAIDSQKFERQFGPVAKRPLDLGLRETVDWYIANEKWWQMVEPRDHYAQLLGQ